MCSRGGHPAPTSPGLPSCTGRSAAPSLAAPMSSGVSPLSPEKSRFLGAPGTPRLGHNGRPEESLSLAPGSPPNLQSSSQVFISRPPSEESQTGIVSPLLAEVAAKAERIPTCPRSREELATEGRRARGSHLGAQAHAGCSCRFLSSEIGPRRTLCSRLVPSAERGAAETRLADPMLSSGPARDADPGSRR